MEKHTVEFFQKFAALNGSLAYEQIEDGESPEKQTQTFQKWNKTFNNTIELKTNSHKF